MGDGDAHDSFVGHDVGDVGEAHLEVAQVLEVGPQGQPALVAAHPREAAAGQRNPPCALANVTLS